MLIKEKIGHLSNYDLLERAVVQVELEWFETNKRILHKKTKTGLDITLKFLQENPQLIEGDILFADDFTVITVAVKACDVIVLQPASMQEMATICYEIGNKHLPLYYQEDKLLIPFDAPLFKMMVAAGYEVYTASEKLLRPMKTSVSPHAHQTNDSLFSKIMKLTNANA